MIINNNSYYRIKCTINTQYQRIFLNFFVINVIINRQRANVVKCLSMPCINFVNQKNIGIYNTTSSQKPFHTFIIFHHITNTLSG